MKITRLQKAKGYRIFRDFSWPASLPDFARFNVIYGWNGSGKTALSNVFRLIQHREALTEGEVQILVDQTRVSGADFASAALPAVRTFNRDTVIRNVFESADQQLPPVFYLGEDSVEKQKQIEALKKQHAEHVAAESQWTRKKSEASTALDNFCAEQARGIKNLLTVAGGGQFNNYNAANFKSDVQRLSTSSPLPEKLTDDQRQHYLATKDGKAMEAVSKPFLSFPNFADLIARTQAMLERSVVLSVISDLAENPKIAAWVNTGLGLHRGELESNKCRFCDQPLPDQRIRQLEAHFNDEFKRFQADVDELINEITAAKNFAKALQPPPKEALYANLRSEYTNALNTLTQQARIVGLSLGVLLRALMAKRDEPFKQFELSQFLTRYTADDEPVGGIETFFKVVMAGAMGWAVVTGQTAFEQLEAIIARHNKHTAGFLAEVKKAREALARDEVLKALQQWQNKTEAVTEADEAATSVHDSAARIKRQIDELEVQVRQHRRPAEELTREVAAYLGRDELRFEVEQNGYRITRGGQPATHLSDGERTAIAFLYFLKSLKGTDFDLEAGIVVIDDPVSSLDANSLFSAFGFMKQRTGTAGQLFVLTHNFAFFRQVKNWFRHLRGADKKQARFYMLATEFVGGERTARLDVLDPFLHDYASEYHYLFKRVYEEAHKTAVSGLEAYYAMPNIARRLLEAFLAFRIPGKPSEFFQRLDGLDYDATKKNRILRFLNTYSHADQVVEPDHDPSVLSETPAILLEVLALICICDSEHYERMEKLVSPATSAQAASA